MITTIPSIFNKGKKDIASTAHRGITEKNLFKPLGNLVNLTVLIVVNSSNAENKAPLPGIAVGRGVARLGGRHCKSVICNLESEKA